MAATITGQCHCGHVRYGAQGPIVKCSYCDCRGCQRATGALNVPFVTVNSADLALTAGALAEFRATSGDACDAHGTWFHCPRCGSPLFWRHTDGTDTDIFAGTLDDTAIFQPPK
jgi:hypothetical protein